VAKCLFEVMYYIM